MERALIVALVLAVSGCWLYRGDDDDGDDDASDGGGAGSCMYMGRTYDVGDTFPADDGCNSCHCFEGGEVRCTLVACLDGGTPDAAGACQPTQGCPAGPACGGICCDQGEQCVNNTCMCGQNPSCGAGDTCEAAGPVGGDACGAVCCGASGPCPQ